MNTLLANQAIDLAIAAILTAVAGVIGSVAFCIRLWGQQRVQGTKLDAVKQQVDAGGAGGTATIVAMPAPAGGTATRPALAAPAWSQLNDPLPDGQQDPYATTDCGEESAAMAIAACGGPDLPAGVLRQLLGGPNRPGLSSGPDLCYLLALFKIAAHPRSCPADVAWTEWQHSFAAGFLVIALGWWVTDGYLHWVLIREMDEAGLTFNDPWGGQVRRADKAWAQLKYQGAYVHIDRAVSAPAPGPP